VADEVDRSALLTALTTEHFTLQGARASTVGESSGRASLYIGTVSSALIALGFVAQVSEAGGTFELFALTIFPVLFFLGGVTWKRMLESSIEDIFYAQAINRIRNYYLELAGPEAGYFMLGGHDDPPGVMRNMGFEPSRWQPLFTSASMVAVVNAVVAGAGVAVALGVALNVAEAVAIVAGALVAVALVFATVRSEERAYARAAAEHTPLFPSPQ
jgi:hypothetical protein